jgi:hypothetical protein
MTRLALVALAVAAATLTGCTSAPVTPASTTVPSPSPTPSATAEEDTAEAADAIVIGPVGFEVQDEAGDVLFAASYEDPLADVLAGLEATLGAQPVEGTDEGHIERPPYRTFAWDGFRIGEAGEPARIAFDVLATVSRPTPSSRSLADPRSSSTRHATPLERSASPYGSTRPPPR